MSTSPPKKTRKPGSGRKRKINAVTSADYARMLEQHVWVPGMSTSAEIAFKKKKRALKNRMSALKSRENKRARLDALQKQVVALQQQIVSLQHENQTLRVSVAQAKPHPRCRSPLVAASPVQLLHAAHSNTTTTCNASNPTAPTSCPFPLATAASPSADLSDVSKQSNPSSPCALVSRESAQRDAMEEFAFGIFDALDSLSDVGVDAEPCDTDGLYEAPAFSEADFLPDLDSLLFADTSEGLLAM